MTARSAAAEPCAFGHSRAVVSASAPIVTPAIVLRATAFGEADRIVTLLGRDTGRLTAMARAARKSQRRFGGGLGLAMTGFATLRERPGAELAGLDSFEPTKARAGLARDVGHTAHAAYAVELVERLSGARQPDPDTFDWLDGFLDRLEAAPLAAERLRVFELGLLGRMGLAPRFDACASCGHGLGDEAARFSPERGGALCTACTSQGRPMSAEVRRWLLRFQTAELVDAEALRVEPALNAACREAIALALALHLDAPLKSLAFIAKLQGG